MKTVAIPLGIVSAYALVRGGQAILIDTGLPGNEKQIIEALDNEGVPLSGVRLIVITHAHPDHSGSAERLRRMTGAPVGIHKDDASFAQTGTNAPVVPATFLGRLMAPVTANMNRKMNPHIETDVIFDETTPLDSYGFPAHVIHTPGHTPGGVCLYGENNLFTGDTLFVGAVGRTDFPGGSFDTLLQSIKNKILTLPDETIIWPGHDYGETPTSTVARERRKNPYITDFL